MRVELILEAIDRASAPIQKVQSAMDGLGKMQSATVAASADRSAQAVAHQKKMAGLATQKDQARGAIVDALATAASVAAPITKAVQQFNAYEDALTDVGLKSDLAGSKLVSLGEKVRSQSQALNMSSVELLGGLNKLMEGGLDATSAEAALGSVAKASIATKTLIADLGQLTVAMINNGKIGAGEVGKALSVLAQTGKDGNAELNRMVPYLPRLTSQFATMGRTGIPAVADIGAAFQVVNGVVNNMEGSAAGIRDMMNKINSDKAQKAFKEAGIDINKVMKEATAAGRPLDAVLETLQKFTGGDLTKINDIFGDIQAQQAVRALLQNMEKFNEIRQRGLAATDTIDRDFATRMGLGVEKTRALSVAMSELGVTVGQALAPMVGAKMEALTKIVSQVEAWAKANPELVATIAQVATAIAGLLVGLAVAKFAFLILRWGVLSVLAPFRLLGTAVSFLLSPFRFLIGLFGGMATALSAAAGAAGGWGALLAALGRGLLSMLVSPLMLAGRAFAMLGAAMMATPVGWIVAALAGIATAAYLIYQNWGRIAPFMQGVWNSMIAGIGNALSSISAAAGRFGQSILSAIQSGWSSVTGWFAGLSWPALPSFTALIGDVFGPVMNALKSGWSSVTGWFSSITWPSLPAIPDPLAGLRAVLDPVLAWVTDWGGKLFGAFEGAFSKIGSFIEGAGAKLAGAVSSVTGGLSKVGEMIFGPSQASIAATKQEIAAVQAAIAAIAPAAQEAVQKTTAILAGANFHSHGVAMMKTLADGIRAGASEAVAATTETVQKIRNLLPHSPAKEGPLSDLHRVKFGQTLAGAIQLGTPSAVAAAAGMAAGLLAAVPTSMAAPAIQQAQLAKPSAAAGAKGSESSDRTSGPVTVNLTLSPNFAGGGGAEFIEQLRSSLPEVAHELAEALRGEMDRRDRVKH